MEVFFMLGFMSENFRQWIKQPIELTESEQKRSELESDFFKNGQNQAIKRYFEWHVPRIIAIR